jgi:hypothetical protein
MASGLDLQSRKGGIAFSTNRFDSNGFTARGRNEESGVAPTEGSSLKQGKESRSKVHASERTVHRSSEQRRRSIRLRESSDEGVVSPN